MLFLAHSHVLDNVCTQKIPKRPSYQKLGDIRDANEFFMACVGTYIYVHQLENHH